MRKLLHVCLLFMVMLAPAYAGHTTPSFIDGAQSKDGRFTITATSTPFAGSKQGRAWTFTWTDTKTGESHAIANPKGVSTGIVYGHLFIASDGETFAYWNPLMIHADSGDAPAKVDEGDRTSRAWQTQTGFSNRLIVYRKDGSVVKTLSLSDFMEPDEFSQLLTVFSRVHWLAEYEGLSYRQTPRPGYALYQISPDYTVLEFKVIAPKGKKPRTVRVSLLDGTRVDANDNSNPERTPVRPFIGDSAVTAPAGANLNDYKDSYVPNLDPVRVAGKFNAAPQQSTNVEATKSPEKKAQAAGEFVLIQDGFKKLDTPVWLSQEKIWVFTDLTANKTYKYDGTKVEVLREGSFRCKATPDGQLLGANNEGLALWKIGQDPALLLKEVSGKTVSLNDIVVSKHGKAYFTTLKDPEKGRLTIVDIAFKTANVAFDGEKEDVLWNPNGVALTPDETFLYVGVSNYKNRNAAGVYRFPIRDDGSIDVSAGRAQKWAAVAAPDGLATLRSGTLFVTSGASVIVLDPTGKKLREHKIPKGSGTNLGINTEETELLLTTNEAIYKLNLSPSSDGATHSHATR